MFTLDTTEGFTKEEIDLMNRALDVLMVGSTNENDEKNYKALINNNFRIDAENTIDSLTRK